MTPEERAKNIVDWLSPSRIKHAVSAPSLAEQKIAAEIRAAVEEDRATRCADDLYKGCYRRGLEEAAKIVLENHEHHKHCNCEAVAEQIRVLKGIQ